MQYFDVDVECPLEPANKLEPHQAVMVILHLPDGSFKCLAIPLEAVYEDQNEYVKKKKKKRKREERERLV